MIKQTHGSLFKKQYHTLPLCLTLLAMNQVHAVEAGVNPVSKTYVDHQDMVLQTQITQLQTEGVAGPTGATGAAGANGTNGTNGATGATGATGSGTTYTVGQQALGGIVFYVDSTGSHGLVASATDNNFGLTVPWRGVSANFTTNATGNGVGAGQMNTSLIVSEQSVYSALSTAALNTSASTVCVNYAIQANGTTACASPGTAGATCYADWYLPSAFELNQMYLQRAVIGGFTGSAYWSSTEASASDAFALDFIFGTQSTVPKSSSSTDWVRCIRAF